MSQESWMEDRREGLFVYAGDRGFGCAGRKRVSPLRRQSAPPPVEMTMLVAGAKQMLVAGEPQDLQEPMKRA